MLLCSLYLAESDVCPYLSHNHVPDTLQLLVQRDSDVLCFLNCHCWFCGLFKTDGRMKRIRIIITHTPDQQSMHVWSCV